jgi:hypothetical protein
MTLDKIDTEVRILYERAGFKTRIGHLVRNKMEAAVCEWLIDRGVAHRHASEVFTVKMGATRAPSIYVPDIILHDKNKDGKTVIIEPLHSYAPKYGGTRIFAAFRKQLKRKYYIIMIAKKHYMHKILKDAYDVLIDFEKLHLLEKKIPFPDRLA